MSVRHFHAVAVKALGFVLLRQPRKHDRGLGFLSRLYGFCQQRFGCAASNRRKQQCYTVGLPASAFGRCARRTCIYNKKKITGKAYKADNLRRPQAAAPIFRIKRRLIFSVQTLYHILFIKKAAASPFYSGKAAAACLYRFKLEPDAAHQEIFLRGRFRFFQLSASKP